MKKLLLSLCAATVLMASDALKGQTVLFEDSFEAYTDFAISGVGNWTLTDVDLKTTYGFNGVTFPNTGVAKSFQVFNSTTTTPPLTPTDTSNWTARTGQKMMVSFASTSAPWNNDWLISPQIQIGTGEGATLSFWAKSCDATYGLEKFRVLVSTTGTAVADFSPITGVIVTPDDATWHEYTYSLNSYSGQAVHIAIQTTSDDQFGFAVDDFRVVSNTLPAVAPQCPTLNAPANNAVNVPFASVNLTWTASTQGGPADAYDVYLDTNPNPTTLVGTFSSTSYTATGLAASTTYYWRVVPKNTAGAASGCAVYSFTTAEPAYCTAGASSTGFEKISNVTFAGINNNSTSTAGYENFTAITGTAARGGSYLFSASFSGNSYSTDQVIVWIDFNNDKDFNDPGEQVFISPVKASPWTGNITIPADAALGNLRMRVRLHDTSAGPNATPCGNSSYGQVEDYTINVTVLGVNDNAKEALRVYPNPVVDVLNIDSPSKVKAVTVFDATGRSVSNHKFDAAKSQINMSGLAAGIYMVTIQMENETKTVKVIKK